MLSSQRCVTPEKGQAPTDGREHPRAGRVQPGNMMVSPFLKSRAET